MEALFSAPLPAVAVVLGTLLASVMLWKLIEGVLKVTAFVVLLAVIAVALFQLGDLGFLTF